MSIRETNHINEEQINSNVSDGEYDDDIIDDLEHQILDLKRKIQNLESRIEKAIAIMIDNADDGLQHKQWILDQVLKSLAGNSYPLYRKEMIRFIDTGDLVDRWSEGKQRTSNYSRVEIEEGG